LDVESDVVVGLGGTHLLFFFIFGYLGRIAIGEA
jgi:hypothetical protein